MLNDMRKYYLVILMLLVLQACSTKNEDILFVRDLPRAEHIEMEVLDVPGLYHPTRLYCFGDKILMKDDRSTECQMYIYDTRTGNLTRALRKGRGPGETIGAFYFAMTEPDSVVVVNDITLVNMLEIPLDSLDKDWYISARHTSSLINGVHSSAICGYEDNSLLVMASYEDSRFVVYDLKDTSVVRKVCYSPDTEQGKLSRLVMTSYDGVIKYNSRHKKSVIACRFADQLEIYDFVKDTVQFIKGPTLFEPECETFITKYGLAGRTITDDTRKGYIDVCCDDRYIYTIYSGRLCTEDHSSYGREIRIFDWKGRPKKVLQTDVDIIALDVDSDGDLYCLTLDDHLARIQD